MQGTYILDMPDIFNGLLGGVSFPFPLSCVELFFAAFPFPFDELNVF
jgi:hypothetical protein